MSCGEFFIFSRKIMSTEKRNSRFTCHAGCAPVAPAITCFPLFEVAAMFGLITRRTSRPHHRPAPLRLQLERLDERIVPAAPTISSLNGRIIASNIIVYGTVQDDSPGSDTVTASGGISGTYHTDASGFFEFIGPYTGNG